LLQQQLAKKALVVAKRIVHADPTPARNILTNLFPNPAWKARHDLQLPRKPG